MKTTTTPPEIQSPLFTFECQELGYSILLVPHTAEHRAKLKRQAKAKDMSLRDFVLDEILGTLMLGQPS